MVDIRKSEIREHQGLSAKYNKFNHLATFNSTESSFYLSFGTALLESLIRMKLAPEYGDLIWDRLLAQFRVAETQALGKEHFVFFFKLVNILREASLQDAIQWLDSYLTRNTENTVNKLDYVIRCLLVSLDQSDELLMTSPFNTKYHKKVIEKVVHGLNIDLFIIDSDGRRMFIEACPEENNILVCLHRDALDNYYVCLLYTSDAADE